MAFNEQPDLICSLLLQRGETAFKTLPFLQPRDKKLMLEAMNTQAAFGVHEVQHELYMFQDVCGSCFQKLLEHFNACLGISSKWFWGCWNFLSSRFRITSRAITQALPDFEM